MANVRHMAIGDNRLHCYLTAIVWKPYTRRYMVRHVTVT